MAKTIEQLKAQGAEVKNATAVGENTATRVGTLFNDIVEHVEDYEAKQAERDTKQNNELYNFVLPFETIPLLLDLYSVIEPAFSQEKQTYTVSVFGQGIPPAYGKNTCIYTRAILVKPNTEIEISWDDTDYKVLVMEYFKDRGYNEGAAWKEESFTYTTKPWCIAVSIVIALKSDGVLLAAEVNLNKTFTVNVTGYIGAREIAGKRLSSFCQSELDDIKENGMYSRNLVAGNELPYLLSVKNDDIGNILQTRSPYFNPGEGKFHILDKRIFNIENETWGEWESLTLDEVIYDRICGHWIERYIKELYIEIGYSNWVGKYSLLDKADLRIYQLRRNSNGGFIIDIALRQYPDGVTYQGMQLLSFNNIKSGEINEIITSSLPTASDLAKNGMILVKGKILCDFKDWEKYGGDAQLFNYYVGDKNSAAPAIYSKNINTRSNCPTLFPNINGMINKATDTLDTIPYTRFEISDGYYTNDGSIAFNNLNNMKHIQLLNVSAGQTVILHNWFAVPKENDIIAFIAKEDGSYLRLTPKVEYVDFHDNNYYITIPEQYIKIGINIQAGLNEEGRYTEFLNEESGAYIEILRENYTWKDGYNNIFKNEATEDNISSLIYQRQNPFNTEANILFADGAKRMLATDTIPLIIVAGQSNADGRADYTTAPQWLIDKNYTISDYMMWSADYDTFKPYDILGNNGADSGAGSDGTGKNKFSFDPFFAKCFIDNYGGKLYAIRQTLGGIGIESQPTTPPRNYTWQPKINTIKDGCNSMCLELLDKIKKAKDWADVNNKKLLPVAILWHQGENDADEDRVSKYQQNLSNLISWIRGVFAAPALPFINGFIQNNYESRYAEINEIFVAMNDIDPFMKSVDMEGHYTSIGDGLHYDSEALQYMGEQMFNKYKELNA